MDKDFIFYLLLTGLVLIASYLIKSDFSKKNESFKNKAETKKHNKYEKIVYEPKKQNPGKNNQYVKLGVMNDVSDVQEFVGKNKKIEESFTNIKEHFVDDTDTCPQPPPCPGDSNTVLSDMKLSDRVGRLGNGSEVIDLQSKVKDLEDWVEHLQHLHNTEL